MPTPARWSTSATTGPIAIATPSSCATSTATASTTICSSASGSGYVGRHGKDFLLAGDAWFRGLDLKYGPDGGVYLSDWCDTGECHNVAQTDRGSGRMYKIVYGEPKPIPADLDLAKLSDAELVKLQLHKNDWYVRHARRILQERAAAGRDMTAVHAALAAMFDREESVPRKLRAFWALHVTDGTTTDFLVAQLRHESEYVRAWAIQFLVEDKHPSDAARSEFARLAKDDPSAFVRLYLASALQRMPPRERWPIAAGLLAHDEDVADHDLPLMIWYGIEPAVAEEPDRWLAVGPRLQDPAFAAIYRAEDRLDRKPAHGGRDGFACRRDSRRWRLGRAVGFARGNARCAAR